MSATASASVVGAKADVVSFSARRSGEEGWEKRVGMRVKPPFVWQETDPSAQCPAPLYAVPRPLAPLSAARADLPRPGRARGAPPPCPWRQAEGRRDRSFSKSAARRRKKHGAGKQYVQNPQGIAVNSFLFEENLQLGNRPFYDLFGLVIGCGWSCAGSERFHGLFLISLANFPPHSAFREPQPLFF